MNKKKILILAASTLTAAAIAVGGTLAYFTSIVKATNTFTVGNVSISMDESKVVQSGIDYVAATNPTTRVTENTYDNIMPASELLKDPKITVKAGSQDCYVGMKVVVSNYANFSDTAKAAFDAMFTVGSDTCILKTGWSRFDDTAIQDGTYILKYDTEIENTVENKLRDATAPQAVAVPLAFDTITIPGAFTTADLESLVKDTKPAQFTIKVTGEAIQSEGFTTADAAFTELFN